MRIIPILILLISLYSCILSEDIPESFDARVKWPNCIPKIQNQGGCGACYAFSISTAFSMRYCIRNNLPKIINFSAQNLLNCLGFGCTGGFPDEVWNYLYYNGIKQKNVYLIKVVHVVVIQNVIRIMLNLINIMLEGNLNY